MAYGLTFGRRVVSIRIMGFPRAGLHAIAGMLLLGHSLCWCPDTPSQGQKPSAHACICCPASHQPVHPYEENPPSTGNCSNCPNFSICADNDPREPLTHNLEQVPAVVAFTVPRPCVPLTLARAFERRFERFGNLSPERQHVSLLL